MSSRKQLEELIFKHGFTDFKWIDPQNIVISQWVKMKCMFGCKEYGKGAHLCIQRKGLAAHTF